jgi:hypothetical protein
MSQNSDQFIQPLTSALKYSLSHLADLHLKGLGEGTASTVPMKT